MRTPKATTAAILAGAVALASAAYGIGTQTDDGTASAARDDSRGGDRFERFHVGGPGIAFGFGGLADELGVDADELQSALEDFREQKAGDARDGFATALAEALGKPVGDVRAALDEVRPGEGMRPGCAPHVSLRGLAAELDVSRSELRDALREARAGEFERLDGFHDDLVAFLADRLGISEDKVREALPEPPRFDRRGPAGPPPFFGP
jgi:Clp amino terminal domain, pathogenicity island component